MPAVALMVKDGVHMKRLAAVRVENQFRLGRLVLKLRKRHGMRVYAAMVPSKNRLDSKQQYQQYVQCSEHFSTLLGYFSTLLRHCTTFLCA